MAYEIETTQQRKDANLANLEAQLGQTAPITDKAFLRVLASMEAMGFTSLAKFAANRAKQNLALTATADDLERLGSEYGVTKKPAESAVLSVSLPADNGTNIPATTPFIGDANGLTYYPTASAIAAGGSADFDVIAEEAGAVGNLQVSDTLSIGTPIAGAESTATVTAIVTTGADEEAESVYRQRVLDEIRSEGGGGNSYDYRRWAQEVAGVARAYPYAGQPAAVGTPPDRTVFVEADTSIDPDGIAPGSLLDDVRDSITTDPLTGLSRQPLGLTDATLYVVSITRTTFYIEITNLSVDPADEAATKDDIETALTDYFLDLFPFVSGLDFVGDKNDIITQLTVSNVVQDILAARAASATAVAIGIAPGVFTTTYYEFDPGEKAKLGTIVYA